MIVPRRLSLARLMTIIVLIAVDCGLVKNAWTRGGWPYPALLESTLPMANLMVLFAPRLRPGRPGRRFWAAFEVAGAALIGLSIYLDLNFKERFVWPITWFMDLEIYPKYSYPNLALTTALIVALYTPPQFLAAWLAGRLAEAFARRRAEKPEDR